MNQNQIPSITWRTNGDNSKTVRIEYPDGRVYVHTNKQASVLSKLVKDRYQSRM